MNEGRGSYTQFDVEKEGQMITLSSAAVASSILELE